jgi:hypothetical protein
VSILVGVLGVLGIIDQVDHVRVGLERWSWWLEHQCVVCYDRVLSCVSGWWCHYVVSFDRLVVLFVGLFFGSFSLSECGCVMVPDLGRGWWVGWISEKRRTWASSHDDDGNDVAAVRLHRHWTRQQPRATSMNRTVVVKKP